MSATTEMHAAEPGETGAACEAAEEVVCIADRAALKVPDPTSAASSHSAGRPAALSWLPDGGGYRAEAGPDLFVRVAAFGESWSWKLVEGGVTAASGIALTLSDAFDAAGRQARQWPTVIKGALRYE